MKLCIGLCSVMAMGSVVNGFVPNSSFLSRRVVVRRFATVEEEKVESAKTTTPEMSGTVAERIASPLPTSPSGVFGKPLSEETVEFNKKFVGFMKKALFDFVFGGNDNTMERAYARFYALETIARMPYFSYLSVLHLYETLGWWRRADYLKVHFAESYNELHHLLIMEDLGGDSKWIHRFVAQHVAFFYYWFGVGCYLFNPTFAYNFNQAVEEHAYDTYDEFVNKYTNELKQLDAPQIAKEYYRDGDLYMFDKMQLKTQDQQRRPKMDNMYDVFIAIRDDELEHVKTMKYLQRDDADIAAPHDH